MWRKSRNAVQAEEEVYGHEYETPRRPTTRYPAGLQRGAYQQQVREHTQDGWTNMAVDPPSQTTREIIHENVFTYFNLIFLILAILLCLVGSFSKSDIPAGHHLQYTDWDHSGDPFQEKVLDRLTMLNAPHAEVIRGGVSLNLEADQLVVDDIVVFRAGNQSVQMRFV